MEPPVKLIRLLIIEDYHMIREGIRMMLESRENYMRFEVDEAENGQMGINKILKKDYDIVLIDYQLPVKNGKETLKEIRLYKKDLKVLALSNYDEYSYIQSMIDEGANGYILKNIEPAELIKAIETVLSGSNYFSNEVLVKMLDAAKNTEKNVSQHKSGLSKRELEVLELIAHEKTNDEIAGILFIAKRTVDTHRQNLLKKLQVKNTAGLIKAAYDFKLL
jgi:DNA-binding NarL/FixJ family response regulator